MVVKDQCGAQFFVYVVRGVCGKRFMFDRQPAPHSGLLCAGRMPGRCESANACLELCPACVPAGRPLFYAELCIQKQPPCWQPAAGTVTACCDQAPALLLQSAGDQRGPGQEGGAVSRVLHARDPAQLMSKVLGVRTKGTF